MSEIKIGDVKTFPNVKTDKVQVMKIIEESAEVFSAWEDYNELGCSGRKARRRLIDECTDVIQAVSNLLVSVGVNDARRYIEDCRKRNEQRGRFDNENKQLEGQLTVDDELSDDDYIEFID